MYQVMVLMFIWFVCVKPIYIFIISKLSTSLLRLKQETGEDGTFKVKFGSNYIVGTYKPMKIDFYDGEVLVVSLNSRGLMNFEHYRTKP